MVDLDATPGLFFLLALFFPVLGCLLLLLGALLRAVLQPYTEKSAGWVGEYARPLYRGLGGDQPAFGAGVVMTIMSGLALLFGLLAMGLFFERAAAQQEYERDAERGLVAIERRLAVAPAYRKAEVRKELATALAKRDKARQAYHDGWNVRADWLRVGPVSEPAARARVPGVVPFGLRIDGLSATLFVLVALLAVLVHVYSMASLADETEEVEDPEVPAEFGGVKRRGRFALYFLYLGLTTVAALHLVVADNLVQFFVSWALLGVLASLLVGFRHERASDTEAARRTFLLHAGGDVAFVAGVAVLWAAVGTVGFVDLERRLRAPLEDNRGLVTPGGHFVHVEPADEPGRVRVVEPGQGDERILLLATGTPTPRPGEEVADATVSTWTLALAGLCLVVAALAKCGQVPFQGWLADVKAAPMSVATLLQTVTLVLAGVYLLGRVYPILTPGVLLVVAYLGLAGLVFGAVVALLVVDLRQILAYSTLSQVGLMLLGLGVGGWSAGLFHLTTHALYKGCLLLGVGCVLAATAGEANLRRLGCLAIKMPLVASATLLATLTLAGMPFLAYWYSSDAILNQAFGYALVQPWHALLFVGPLVVAGVTAFTLFRMWILTFQGLPREPEPFLRADEPAASMTFPLLVLAVLSVTVAWGMPPWDPNASWLEDRLATAQPASVQADFGTVPDQGEVWHGGAVKPPASSERLLAHHYGIWSMLLALLSCAGGVYLAYRWYAPKEPLMEPELFAALGIPMPGTEPAPPMPQPVPRPRIWYEEEEEVAPVAPTAPAASPPPTRVPPPVPIDEPTPAALFVAGGFGLDRLYRLLFVRPAAWLGRGLAWVDDALLAGFFQRLAAAVVAVGRAQFRLDKQVDAAVEAGGRSVGVLAGWLRAAEAGRVGAYLVGLAVVAAAVGVAVYFFI